MDLFDTGTHYVIVSDLTVWLRFYKAELLELAHDYPCS